MTLRSALLIVTFLACANPASLHASSITIEGTTTACFGTGCSIFSDNPSSSTGAFTFDGDFFSITTDASGSFLPIDLGDLSRAGASTGNFSGTLDFTLRISFSAPALVTPNPSTYEADIIGHISGQGVEAWVNFDNALHLFEFPTPDGTGSFTFGVVDIGTAIGTDGGGLGKGDTSIVSGLVQNAQLPPSQTTEFTPIPEPASLVLLGTGLLGVCWRARRRTTNR